MARWLVLTVGALGGWRPRFFFRVSVSWCGGWPRNFFGNPLVRARNIPLALFFSVLI